MKINWRVHGHEAIKPTWHLLFAVRLCKSGERIKSFLIYFYIFQSKSVAEEKEY